MSLFLTVLDSKKREEILIVIKSKYFNTFKIFDNTLLVFDEKNHKKFQLELENTIDQVTNEYNILITPFHHQTYYKKDSLEEEIDHLLNLNEENDLKKFNFSCDFIDEDSAKECCMKVIENIILNRTKYNVSEQYLNSLIRALNVFRNFRAIKYFGYITIEVHIEFINCLTYVSHTIFDDHFEINSGGSRCEVGVGSDSYSSEIFSTENCGFEKYYMSELDRWEMTFFEYLDENGEGLLIEDSIDFKTIKLI